MLSMINKSESSCKKMPMLFDKKRKDPIKKDLWKLMYVKI